MITFTTVTVFLLIIARKKFQCKLESAQKLNFLLSIHESCSAHTDVQKFIGYFLKLTKYLFRAEDNDKHRGGSCGPTGTVWAGPLFT